MNEIDYTTAGNKTTGNIRKRILAGFVDYFIINSFIFMYVYIVGEPNAEGDHTVNGFPALVPFIFWGLMTVGIEIGQGATIGNSIMGLKAIPENGNNRKLTFGESLKRHLLDPIDMLLFGLIGIITIKNTNKNQRLGDIWGKTIVVRNEAPTN